MEGNGALHEGFLSLALARLSTASSRARLTALPRELQFRIRGYLSPVSKVSLGLTCRDLWPLVSDQDTGALTITLTGRQKYELCCWLSIDHPRLLACYACKMLHKRDLEEFKYIFAGGLYQLCQNMPAAIHPSLCPQYALSYEMIELAVRFDQVSSEHGIPLGLLSRQCNTHNFHRGSPALPLGVEILPRICNGRLLLRIDSFTEVVDTETKCAGDQTEEMFNEPCVHMTRNAFETHCGLNIRLGNYLSGTYRADEWYAMDRCTRCATDSSTRLIYSEDGKKVLSLQMRVWKDLGGWGAGGGQPWTGHVGSMPITSESMYALGDKHLGHIFDGHELAKEPYDKQISLAGAHFLQSPWAAY
jgi:hypothetical protein